MPASIRLWFDFSSPCSCVGDAYIDTLAARRNRGLQRHAILLRATVLAGEARTRAARRRAVEAFLESALRAAAAVPNFGAAAAASRAGPGRGAGRGSVFRYRLHGTREAANGEAIAVGAIGAPLFDTVGEPFRVHDRKPQIERWLSSGPL